MKTAKKILLEAKSRVGNPWCPNFDCKDASADSIRFYQEVVLSSLGLNLEIDVASGQRFGKEGLLNELRSIDHLSEADSCRRLKGGDCLVFRIKARPSFIGICNGSGMIYPDRYRGVVEISELSESWKSVLCAVFRVK